MTLTAPTPRQHSSPPSARFRPEINGLRALALALVLIYHIWVGRVSGGVDAFLLISAFLLTSSFAARAANNRPLAIAKYWRKIFLRLTPTATAVLLATLASIMLLFPEIRWTQLIQHAWASLLYAQNWALVLESGNYQIADAATASPFQHFWSLSIQGQVFILWPLLLLMAAVIARRYRPSFTAIAAALFLTIFLGSMAFAIAEANAGSGSAYFDTRARLWEFALGSLLALALPHVRLRPGIRVALGWVGLLGLASCGILIRDVAAYPGWGSLLPTLSAALVIAAGSTAHRWGADRWLTARPIQRIGDLSYGIYLWHWPLLVVYFVIKQKDAVTIAEGLGIIALAVLLAWCTERFFDRPLRFLATTYERISASFLVVLAVMVAVPLLEWQNRIHHAETQLQHQSRELNPGAAALDANAIERSKNALPIPAATALDEQWGNAGPACEQKYAPDHAAIDSCHQIEPTAPAQKTIAVIGDSHARQLMTGIMPLAQERNWRVISLLKNACRYGAESTERDPACNAHNAAAREHVLEISPDAVITLGTMSLAQAPRETMVPEYAAGIEPFLENKIEVLAIRDNPRFDFNMYECVALHGSSAAQCNPPRNEVIPPDNPLEELSADVPLLHSVDFTDAICTQLACPAIVGNVYVYRDYDHLNKTYVETMIPAIKREILEKTGW